MNGGVEVGEEEGGKEGGREGRLRTEVAVGKARAVKGVVDVLASLGSVEWIGSVRTKRGDVGVNTPRLLPSLPPSFPSSLTGGSMLMTGTLLKSFLPCVFSGVIFQSDGGRQAIT